MMTSLYSEPIPVTEITSDWCKFHFPRDSRVITCVNLNLAWVVYVYVYCRKGQMGFVLKQFPERR